MSPLQQFDPATWSAPLERQLASYAPLREPHLAFARSRLGAIATYAAEEALYGPARGEAAPLLVVSGWAGAAANLEDGRRQLVRLFLPGDIVEPSRDLQTGLEAVALTTVRTMAAGDLIRALTASQTAATQPLADAWACVREAASARLVRHIVRLGRMSAYERAADLFLELHERQQRAGLADERGMSLPLTQEMMADHLGLSVVHMNRTLQQLRRDNMVATRGGRLMLLEAGRIAHRSGDAGTRR